MVAPKSEPLSTPGGDEADSCGSSESSSQGWQGDFNSHKLHPCPHHLMAIN